MSITDGRPPWNELVMVTNHTMGLRVEHYLYNTTDGVVGAEGAQGVTHYDSRSDRAFTSPLSCRTISVVRRMSPSLRPTPRVDAIARNRAVSSR